MDARSTSVTPEDIEAEIASEHYFTAAEGRHYARKMALDDVWPKMGMRLADMKYRDAKAREVVAAMDAESP
ncbi:hypothetical protein [Luteimonas saliphila]|uniref:hypothetical protein n=1 Tax=Luteimonas saliphila TaxID=2804919 RepID=UPI00192DE746|nr:hypothetical protein [Luteimonas saliphila]